MIISYNKKFIFLHNRKVAGTSIKKILKDYGLICPCRSEAINQLSEKFALTRFLNYKISMKIKFIANYRDHATALELKEQLPPDIWDSFYKFTFVRNPWDLQVSLYFYMLKRKDHFQHELVKKMESFDEYIEWVTSKQVLLQKEYIYDVDNQMIVDFFGRYENLEDDFKKITNRIGIKATLPHINKSNHKNYQKYYNNKTKYLVGEKFKEDINLFKYDF